MGSNISKWLKKNLISKYVITNCPQREKCVEILYLILDGEANKEQEEYYTNHIDECWNCFKDYQLEKAIKELVQNKIERKVVPADLIEEIKLRISESA